MIIDWTEKILTDLLSIFERRDVSRTGIFANSIYINVRKDKKYKSSISTYEEQSLFESCVYDLAKEGVITYEWESGEEGNIIEKLILVPDMDKVIKAYDLLGIVPPFIQAEKLQVLISAYIPGFSEDSDIRSFLYDVISYLSDKRKLPRFFTDDFALSERILRCLLLLSNNDNEILVRVMSKNLFNDSKVFENQVKQKVCPILRAISGNSELKDDELLEERGIVSNPEILSFRGHISVETEYGCIDYSNEKHGAYINTRTVNDVLSVNGETIKRVLFIENLANYTDYIEHNDNPEELVIYHGGCYSPVKGIWFKKVHDSLADSGCSNFYHWSDIDYGGFNIFTRLRDNIIPELQPYKMDVETLEMYADKNETLGSDEYRKRLEKQLQDDKFSVFHEVIRYMLEHDIWLEQESII